MSSFKEGRQVLYRPTDLLCTTVRWDRENNLLLLKPVRSSAPKNATTHDGNTSKNNTLGTRWAFEKDVVAVENNTTSKTKACVDTTYPRHAAAKSTASDPHERPQALSGTSARVSIDYDPTPYFRRSAKLDERVEIRANSRDPKRGRGLYATKYMPAGTEVMRVRAVGVVLSQSNGKSFCCRCFLSQKSWKSATTCFGCGLRFCDRCARLKLKDVAHKAMCELSKIVFQLCVSNRGVDEGILRLSADILARKKAGTIGDEEWDLLSSLESDDNQAGAIGLGARALEECVQLFKDVMDIDVSKEDLQTMYRRVSRNSHAVSPDQTAVGFGHVQALFPCGALVNHSCRPNSLFHSVTKASADGIVVEQVLRTICQVRAGEELCSSYLADFATASVSERRNLLESWGFRCTCTTCLIEIKEGKKPERHRRPGDATASKKLEHINGLLQLTAREEALAGVDGAKYADLAGEVLRFLQDAGDENLSPRLRRRLSMATMELVVVADVQDPIARFSAFMAAANALCDTGDPRFIDMRYKQSKEAMTMATGNMAFLSETARKALTEASKAAAVFYGKDHQWSVQLQKMLRNFPA